MRCRIKTWFIFALFLSFSACLVFITPLSGQEGGNITIETEPAGCPVKIYEWTPFSGNKGKIIIKGDTPLDIPQETLKDSRGIIIVVEAKEKGYLNEERTFFTPYSKVCRLQLQSQKDYDSIKAKAEEYVKVEKERKTTILHKVSQPGAEANKYEENPPSPQGTEYEQELEKRNQSLLRRR